MRKLVRQLCAQCPTCQKTKKSLKKYGHVPVADAEMDPWEILCVDLIGPYTIHRKKPKKPLILWAITMMDPATGWFEIREIKNKSADEIANHVETTWLSRYPWPSVVRCDRGSEFKKETKAMFQDDYGITVRNGTTHNPQSNGVLERIHATIGQMLRTHEVYKNDSLDEDDPWTGILTAVSSAVRSTYSTVRQASPMELVFGRNTFHNTKFAADWEYLRERKQTLMSKDNKRENKTRIAHTYRENDSVMVKQHHAAKYGGPQYEGPFKIVTVFQNGTVRIKKKTYYDTVNIRQIKPYAPYTPEP